MQMIGGLTMKSFYKNKFALSDQGAEALTKASISSFFVYCINMVPAFIIMMLIDELV
ncbi:TPA: ABC transporter ATP-binding protein, partial [Enterococcus faecium]